MSAPTGARTNRSSAFPGLPTIPQRSTEDREVAQIRYLVWRLELFLKDARAHTRAKEFRTVCENAWKGGASYDRMRQIIEEHMNGYLAAQAQIIQSIYNEK